MTKFKQGDEVRVLYTKDLFKVVNIFFNENKKDSEPLYELSNETEKNVFIFEKSIEKYKYMYHNR